MLRRRFAALAAAAALLVGGSVWAAPTSHAAGPVTAIDINPATLSIEIGTGNSLSAVVTPSDADDPTVTWTSSDGTIATVDSSGGVFGVAPGTVTITATANDGSGVFGTATVTVRPAVTSVTVTLSSASVMVGGTVNATATVAPVGANPGVGWSSSDTSVATVDPISGVVTAVAVGSADIIATAYNHVTGQTTLTVVPPAATLVFNVNGDWQAGGTIGGAVGAVFTLTDSGNPVSTEWWATCVVDAAGQCTFDIPPGGVLIPSILAAALQPTVGWTQQTSPTITVYALSGTYTAYSPTVLERTNPTLSATCGATGVNVALVVDLSGSMSGTPLDTLKTDAKAYVNAMKGTNASIALFTFGTTAPADNGVNQNRPLTSVATTAGANLVNGWIDGLTANGGGTSWDLGLAQVATSGVNFDIVIFISDGDPGSSFASNVAAANAVKATNARILAVLASTYAGALEITNLESISGPVTANTDPALNDYFVSDWANIGSLLNSLTSICKAPQVTPTPTPMPTQKPASGGPQSVTGGSVIAALPFGGAIALIVLGLGLLFRRAAAR